MGRGIAKAAVVLVALGGAVAAWWFLRPDGVVARDEVPGGARDATPPADLAAPAGEALAGRGVTPSRPAATVAARRVPTPVGDGPRLVGRVVDREGRGIAGARVLALPDTEGRMLLPDDVGASGGTGAENATDAEGRFVVAAVGTAPYYAVYAEADGFAPGAATDVRPSAEIRIVLGRGRSLAGRVLALDGEPVGGATVRVLTHVDLVRVERETVAGPDGAYRLDLLPKPSDPSNAYAFGAIVVTREGFAPLYVEGFGRPVPGTPDAFALDLVMVRGATLVGTVVDDESGRPIEGAHVVLVSIEGMMGTTRPSGVSLSSPWAPRLVAETTSGPDGAFRVEHVPAAGFHACASHNASRRGGTALGHVGAWKDGWTWASDDVLYGRDGATLEAEVRIRPACAVSGRVVDGAGKPVAGVTVAATRVGAGGNGAWLAPFLVGKVPSPWAKTGDDGGYRLDGAPASAAGETTLQLAAYVPRRRFTSSATLPPQTTVAVRAGARVVAPDLVIGDGSDPDAATGRTVSLLVVDAAGAPVAGARVENAGMGWGPGVSPRTDRAGRAAIPFPPTRGGGATPPAAIVRAAGFAPASLAWPTGPATDEVVRVVLGVSRRVEGCVRQADRAPSPSTTVLVYNGAVPLETLLPKPNTPSFVPRAPVPGEPALTFYGAATTDGDGCFVASDLPDGPYHLVAGDGAARATRSDVPSDATGVELTLGADRTAARGRIRGAATDATTGRPVLVHVGAVRRRAPDEAAAGPSVVRSDDRTIFLSAPAPTVAYPSLGRFEVTPEARGTFDVTIGAPGYVAQHVEVTVGLDDVDLAPVALSRGIRLHGTVRSTSGPLPADLSLWITSVEPTSRAGVTATIERGGGFDVSGLVPGRYRLQVQGSGFSEATANRAWLAERDEPIELAEGASDVTVDWTFAPAGTLALGLVDPRFPPLPWSGEPTTDAQRAFGKASSLTITTPEGRAVRAATSLEQGLPPALGWLVLLPGRYRVRLTLPDGTSIERAVDVTAGARADVALGTPAGR